MWQLSLVQVWSFGEPSLLCSSQVQAGLFPPRLVHPVCYPVHEPGVKNKNPWNPEVAVLERKANQD